MTGPESETANKAGYLFAVIIASQLIVTAFGLALDHPAEAAVRWSVASLRQTRQPLESQDQAATLSPHR